MYNFLAITRIQAFTYDYYSPKHAAFPSPANRALDVACQVYMMPEILLAEKKRKKKVVQK